MTPVKAWAVLDPEDELRPCGQCGRWQYPIFYTRAEARDYLREGHGLARVKRVVIALAGEGGSHGE